MMETRTKIVGGEIRVVEVDVESELTEREHEVLAALAHGTPNKVIAAQLALPLDTVRSRLKRIYRKLGVQNRNQAMLAAYRLGLVDLEAAS